MKECTFKPHTNHSPERIPLRGHHKRGRTTNRRGSAYHDAREQHHDDDHFHDAAGWAGAAGHKTRRPTYEEEVKRRQDAEAARAVEKVKIELSGCTFKPRINRPKPTDKRRDPLLQRLQAEVRHSCAVRQGYLLWARH